MILSDADLTYFAEEQARLESAYLAGANPREQSGFHRDARDWERFRRVVVAPVTTDGSFLDIGCASGLLMESVAVWAAEDGHSVQLYGLDISERLADLARRRLPAWRDRIFTGNALVWDPPSPFDYVRTELVYVPTCRRREYVERLLQHVVAPDGRLIVCSYGSSRPEGARAERCAEELERWGMVVDGVHDVVSPEHGFVITHVVSLSATSHSAQQTSDTSGTRRGA
jgi:SAM-dependent methyltransferase